ncbi:putative TRANSCRIPTIONal REGULATOR, GntR family [Cupriavidus taiwanensis]|uniref:TRANSCRIPTIONal REGULATOR, GntR family n=1 Tax=Cupriavidus taiwanensis TaxID=164546 RepID=A0A375E9X8_9BURK|nr:GntR family transcriptional regulator [Cupriavidus taiwanensis]SOZ20046.1 putative TRANSCRIPTIONal REGULATOR, GntR family [Cupriavidus taiwanensis]SOZ33270.1 putative TRANSCRIPTIONal REGULATOR, GntR family [Cupriavidus taiwanensis]SOZ48584.1 putative TRANSCRIPTIONal REGULATOR, GntR family [Cupriavidus taiwanensis]SOZ62944.1 putative TRANSCRIPTIONal REGULATOR, GntR family [Cupriavidus taiwanensis]SOZ63664.1 putative TRANSCRIPTIONal REGULATOR, GntR family [Cupriavidus taiwanensis]
MGSRFDAGAAIGGVLYKDVKQAILAALAEGEWKPGEAIPSERKLIERFGVSIGTLRKAIDELVAENIMIRHQGRGTFVATHRQEDHFFRFFRIVRQDGYREFPTVQLAKFRRAKADKEEAAALGLPLGEAVFRFTNVLSLEGRAVMIDAITVPAERFRTLSEKLLRERPNTLYNFYQDVFGINIIRTEERLRAALANEEDHELLGIPVGTAMLKILRVASSYQNERIEYRVSRLDTSDYEFALSQP